MFKRPINEMLHSSLESLSNLIDSSKVIGKPIQIGEDKIVVPISKVTLGFGVGGSEFNVSNKKNKKLKNELSFEVSDELYPYGGGQLGGMRMDTCYTNLANAIILAAAKDHRRALRRLKKYPWDKDAESVRKDCERFFRSGWFQTLTSLDGEVLIEKLHREVYGV